MAIARMECRARVEANNTREWEKYYFTRASAFLIPRDDVFAAVDATLLKLAINAHASTQSKLFVMKTNFVPGGCDLFDQHRLCERD